MKGMTKLLLGAAFIFGVLGGAFCVASLCLGFSKSDLAQVIQSGRFHAAAGLSGEDFTRLTAENTEFEQSYRGIDELDLNISGMECRLAPWEGEEWKVTGWKLSPDFKCRESDGTLKIRSGGERTLFRNFPEENACLEILFPEGAVLNGLEADSSAGSILMEEGILVCEGADVDCGIGNCTLRLDIKDELKIECGVGDVSLLLAGAETDFDYKLDCGVGDITINKGVSAQADEYLSKEAADHSQAHGTDHSEDGAAHEEEHAVIGAKQKVDHDADRRVRISCGVGAVTLNFTEE